MEMKSGSVFSNPAKTNFIPTLCLYKIPIFVDNYLIFECWDPRCSYFFKVSVLRVDDKLKYIYPPHVHRCVYHCLGEVYQIWPQNVAGKLNHLQFLLVNKAERITETGSYLPFSSTFNVEAIIDDEDQFQRIKKIFWRLICDMKNRLLEVEMDALKKLHAAFSEYFSYPVHINHNWLWNYSYTGCTGDPSEEQKTSFIGLNEF